MMREIFVAYVEQAGEILSEIKSAIQQNHQEIVSRAAHKLGGSSATCGITEVAATLKRLEHLGAAYTVDAANKLHQEAAAHLAEAEQFIQQYLDSI